METALLKRTEYQAGIARLIQEIRHDYNALDGVLEVLSDQPSVLAEALSGGDLSDAVTLASPAYGPFAEACAETLKLAVFLSRLGSTDISQMTGDYIAGEWVQFTQNAQTWSDILLILQGVTHNTPTKGWGRGVGTKMAAIWNYLDAERDLTAAKTRLYHLQTVDFGDAKALIEANDGIYPNNIPTNGSLRPAVKAQEQAAASAQAKLDMCRQSITAALNTFQVPTPAPLTTGGMRRERPGARL
ncbi:MAG: hypothetical protein AAF826_01420 [Pseudomonadota bacterium]